VRNILKKRSPPHFCLLPFKKTKEKEEEGSEKKEGIVHRFHLYCCGVSSNVPMLSFTDSAIP